MLAENYAQKGSGRVSTRFEDQSEFGIPQPRPGTVSMTNHSTMATAATISTAAPADMWAWPAGKARTGAPGACAHTRARKRPSLGCLRSVAPAAGTDTDMRATTAKADAHT